MKAGPEGLEPYLLMSGRDQLGMDDRDDAGVLATAIAARANLLVTDNLKDFETNDSERVDMQTVVTRSGARQLFSLVHRRVDGVALIVTHPIDLVRWCGAGFDITPALLRPETKA